MSERFRQSKTLAADPDFARLAEIVRRSEAAAFEAEKAVHKVRSQAPAVTVAPFDEEEAARRIRVARAHDVVHASGSETKERQAIEAEVGKVHAEASAAAKAHADRLEAARQAHEASVIVLGNSRVELQTLAAAKAAEHLPQLAADILARSRELFDLCCEARALLAAGNPSASPSRCWLDVTVEGLLLNDAATLAAGGHPGSARGPGLHFEQR